jgi:hypothetical protein
MDKSVIVSVRLPEAELRRLQLLAQVYEQSVGELIRVAVSKHVEELTRTEEFKTRALELKRRNEDTLNELLDGSDPIVNDTNVVRTLPRLVSGSHANKRPVDSSQAEVLPEFLHAEVGRRPVGYSQLEAAASHKRSKGGAWRQFRVVWKQGEDEWSMEGKDNEVVLNAPTGVESEFITWKSSRTATNDRFALRSSDGRTLVEIPFAKAFVHAEALRDTLDAAERSRLLPMVHSKRN